MRSEIRANISSCSFTFLKLAKSRFVVTISGLPEVHLRLITLPIFCNANSESCSAPKSLMINEIFDRYVKLDRLELTDIISVDEVHTEIESDCKYALVIQDFHTGDDV